MKTYVMTITDNQRVTRLTADVETPNLAYFMFSASCEAILFGFGDAKSTKLAKIMGGGTMEYKFRDVQTKITVEVL